MRLEGLAENFPNDALPLFIGGTDVRSKDREKLVFTLSYEKEEDKRSEINWDRFSGEGVQNTRLT